MTLSVPAGAVINCADSSGTKNLSLIATFGFGVKLNSFLDAGQYHFVHIVC